ncbi:unnamed protein product [Amoebophrya sp. A120]|nr:unnamed protein product [Amoebophrya sp. A120]|eukprot:GSA120T00015329001.1
MSAVRPAWMRYFPRMERARMQDPNDAIEFGELPVEFVECPYCRRKNGVSFVDHEASAMTYALSFCILCACGWFSLCLLPLVWPVLRTVVHRCPDCRNVLAKKNRVRCPRVQNEVFTMEMSGCAVVLSKKYLILFCVLLLLIFIFLWRGDHHGSHLLLDAPTGGRDLDGETGTWPGYLKFCGYRKSLGNPLRARRKFDEMYAGNRVLWEGRVSKILEGFHIFFWDAPGMIKVDMIPAENSRNAEYHVKKHTMPELRRILWRCLVQISGLAKTRCALVASSSYA